MLCCAVLQTQLAVALCHGLSGLVCRLVDGQPVGGPCSRLDKMKASLLLHLPTSPDSDAANADLISSLTKQIQQMWALDLGLKNDASKSSPAQAVHQSVMHDAAAADVPVEATTVSDCTKHGVNLDAAAVTAVTQAVEEV